MSSTKKQKFKTSQFVYKLNYKYFLRIFRVFEQLSNSIRCRFRAFSQNGQDYLLQDWSFYHDLGSRNLRKLIKVSKDSNYSLVSNKTLSQKIGSLGWLPGPDDLDQKCINLHPL